MWTTFYYFYLIKTYSIKKNILREDGMKGFTLREHVKRVTKIKLKVTCIPDSRDGLFKYFPCW